MRLLIDLFQAADPQHERAVRGVRNFFSPYAYAMGRGECSTCPSPARPSGAVESAFDFYVCFWLKRSKGREFDPRLG